MLPVVAIKSNSVMVGREALKTGGNVIWENWGCLMACLLVAKSPKAASLGVFLLPLYDEEESSLLNFSDAWQVSLSSERNRSPCGGADWHFWGTCALPI